MCSEGLLPAFMCAWMERQCTSYILACLHVCSGCVDGVPGYPKAHSDLWAQPGSVLVWCKFVLWLRECSKKQDISHKTPDFQFLLQPGKTQASSVHVCACPPQPCFLMLLSVPGAPALLAGLQGCTWQGATAAWLSLCAALLWGRGGASCCRRVQWRQGGILGLSLAAVP